MANREEKLAESVRELGRIVSELTYGGKCSPRMAAALERARDALRSK